MKRSTLAILIKEMVREVLLEYGLVLGIVNDLAVVQLSPPSSWPSR